MARRRKKRRTAAQRRATRKMIAANKRRKKVRRNPKRRVATVARKRRKSSRRRAVARRSSRRRARRSGGTIRFKRVKGSIYRRNPGFNVKAILGRVQRAAMRIPAVLGGKVGTRFIANVLPFPNKDTNVAMNMAAQVTGAIITSIVAGMVVPRYADDVLLGGLLAPAETLGKQLPIVGPLLGDDYLELGAYPDVIGDDEPIGELPIGEYEEVGAYEDAA